jgi:hypothetical protein
MEGLSKPSTKAGRLQRACMNLILEHEADGAIPTSIRFIFYELESRGIVPKDYRNPDGSKRPRTPSQDVAEAIKVLRECGLVPWSWIVDETRSLHSWRFAKSAYEYVLGTLPEVRIDLWGGERPTLILCESRSLAGVLERIAASYLCPIAATNGQAGGFLHTEVAPLVNANGSSYARRVLYLGDLDLSGSHIEENTRRVLSDYGDLEWQRLAITLEQVRANNLTAIDKKDHRFNPARTFPAVETEALRQAQIQQILTSALDAMVPEPLAEVLEREEEQRVRIRQRLDEDGYT